MRGARADEFYVGWAPRAPRALARRLRWIVAGLFAAIAGLALLFASASRTLDLRTFEFTTPRAFAGAIELSPAPTLVVSRPGGGESRYLLVGPGKRGARALVDPFAGRRVRLEARLLSRGAQTALEVEPGSIVLEGPASAPPGSGVELGPLVLQGEIVDSKCHFGVMNPGEGKAHRGCAVACIRGGSPPVLRVSRPEGSARYFVLAGSDGRDLAEELVDFVAEPVLLVGRGERHGDVYVLRIAPGAVRRLEGGPGE
jgi:hypothetical protein